MATQDAANRRRLRPVALRISSGVVGTVALAGASNYALGATSPSTAPFADTVGLFLLGTLVLWVLVVLLLAVTGRFWATTVVVVALTATTAYANAEKVKARQEPLYPSDLQFATQVEFLTDMVGSTTPLLAGAAGLVVLAVVSALLARRLRDRLPGTGLRTLWGRRRLALARLATAALCLGALGYVGQFNDHGNGVRAAHDLAGARWVPYRQATNYATNGFVAGFLYNLPTRAMPKPPGYDEAAMRRVLETYADAAAEQNLTRTPDALADVNVVVVLSETFTDPRRIETVGLAEDPIPFTRELMARTTSGTMLAQNYGGGTANTEFAALTGQSPALFAPQVTTPYQQLVPNYRHYPSVVGYLNRLGHRSVAVHPFKPTMYSRRYVYPSLGFDESVFADGMERRRRLGPGGFIADSAVFDTALDLVDGSDSPVLAHLVTMQNHLPFEDKYDDPMAVSGAGDADEAAVLGQYARGLRHSDDALRRFVQALEEREEKTVVLFFGDHQPSFWSEETLAANPARRMLETPFLVWTNFTDNPARRLPTTSPAHFMNHVLEAVDAPVPPFYALLAAVEKELPGIGPGGFVGPDDRWIRPADLSPRARQVLADYRLVQYDLSVGEGYVADELFYPPAGAAARSGTASGAGE